MKIIYPLILTAFILTSCGISESGSVFDIGKGTEEVPFLISNIDQLQSIGDPEYLDKHFLQIKDIDASKSAEFQNGSGFKRIGDIENPFTGSYNGNGFVIQDIHVQLIKKKEHYGVFGYTKNARLENITIDNSSRLNQKEVLNKGLAENLDIAALQETDPVDFTEVKGYGGLAGVNDGGIVRNCKFIGVASAYIGQTVAGLVGINTGIIRNSSVDGRVSGGGVSGLVDWNTGEIYHSDANVSLSGQTEYGLARVNEGLIFESTANIEIGDINTNAGLVGYNMKTGRIESSYVTGSFDGYFFDLFGMVVINSGEIVNSYSQMKITAEFYHDPSRLQRYGGLVIENEPTGFIETSYAAGSLIIEPTDNIILTGAVAAENYGEIRSVYWDRDVIDLEHSVGEGSDEGTIGLTTSQMSGPSAQQNMPEFDWQNVWTTTPDGYPILRWQEED